MKKKESKARTTNSHATEVLAKISAYQRRQVPLLDEMTAVEQISYYEQALAWLSRATPRTTRYLTRRAHAQISGDLDVEMADDIWWFHFLEINLAHLHQQISQEMQE